MSNTRTTRSRGWLPTLRKSRERGARRLVLTVTTTAASVILLGCGAPQTEQTARQALATGIPAAQATATALPSRVEAAASALASQVEARASELAAGASSVAGNVQAARTDVAATVQAAASGAASAVQAVGSTAEARASNRASAVAALEPTAAALQTMVAAPVEARLTAVAPTVAALATAIAGAVQPAIATAVADSPVEIAGVQVSPDDTTVALRNRGSEPVLITGWLLVVDVVPLVLPTGQYPLLDPDETRTFHFARGVETEQDVYMGMAPQGLIDRMQPGTNLVLLNARGELASIYQLP